MPAACATRAEEDPNLATLHLAALADDRLVARRHRQRFRAMIDHVIEEGAGAQLFRVRSRERATAVVLDVLYRFLDPVSVAADRGLPRTEIDSRLNAVTRLVLRALHTGLV